MAVDNTKISALITALDARYINEGALDSALNEKVDKVTGKGLSTNDLTDALKTKLDNIEEGANAYVHPDSTQTAVASGLYKIATDSKGHITDATAVAKADLDALIGTASGSSAGLMSSADKTALDGLADAGAVTLSEITASAGAFKTYQLTQGTTIKGTIDIPKDFLVKSGSVKTVSATPTTAETNAQLSAGQKYISLIINTKDDITGQGDELIIPAGNLVDIYQGTANQINVANNTISIANGGVTSTELASDAVTTAKITDANVTLAKLASDVKTEWTADADNEINAFIDALTQAL